MSPNELRARLHGVIAFPVTPFQRDLSLNLEGLRQNLRHLLRHPVCAVVAGAGTGEFHNLAPSEQLSVVRTTVQEVQGRVPVLAATGFSLSLGCDLARAAAGEGADGLLVFPPYYPHADDDGLLAYYRNLGLATPLGVVIYSRDWFHPNPPLVERLAEAIPNLIAWKDGQADLRRYQMIQARVGDRLLWVGGAGDDMVPGYYAMGIRTYTSSIANVAPRLSLRLHELASSGPAEDLHKLMGELVLPLYALRSRRRGYEVAAMKAMMDLMGLSGGPVRPPLVELRSDEREILRSTLEAWRPWM